jgi:uncharacterized membrane protein
MTPHTRFAARCRSTALVAALAAGPALAGTPLYHLTVLSVPDASTVQALDINDAGQAVGRYLDQDFNARAVLWDADGTVHDLALPDTGDGIAYAINNHGQIVGTFDDYVLPQKGVLWDASAPGTPNTLTAGPDEAVSPQDINDNGVVVGGFGLPAHSRAFVWTSAGGLVDYGLQDANVEFQQARWAAVNSAGKLVGHWNAHSSNIHATAGQVGTPAVLSMSTMTEDFASVAVAMNEHGTAVGLGLAAAAPVLVPVVFADDGTFSEIPNATLDQPNGCASAINDSGVIIGRAGIGTASGCAPGMKVWVYRDNTVYNLYDVVDDHGIFTSFITTEAINASGIIVGTGRTANDEIMSFVLTPILADEIFVDGFDG